MSGSLRDRSVMGELAPVVGFAADKRASAQSSRDERIV